MEKIRKFETEQEYLDIKNSFEYPQVSLTDDNGKVWVKEVSYVIAKYNASPEELSSNELDDYNLIFCGLYKAIIDFDNLEIMPQEKPEIVEQSILLSYDEVNNISTYKFILKDEYEEYDFSTAFGGIFAGSGAISSVLNYLDLSNVKKPIINLDINTKLDKIILNDKLKSINEFGCLEITFDKNFVLPQTLESIGNWAFTNSLCLLSMFSNVQHLNPQENEYWGAIIVDEITDNGLYIKDNIIIGSEKNTTSLVIPNYVKGIKIKYYLSRNMKLKEIICENNIPFNIDLNTFSRIIEENGVLKVPQGSDYSSWMLNDKYYLGYYNWTIEYI